MKTFQTVDGQEWQIDLNIETARNLRAQMRGVPTLKEVDFLDYAALLTSLNDVFFAADLLFLTCQKQAEERGIDASAFGGLLKGSVLFDGIAAFTAEYLDFFPNPTIAEKMRAFVEKMKAAQETIMDAIESAAEKTIGGVLDDLATKSGARFSTASPSPEGITKASNA